jgi:hypothetical protein
MSPENVMGDVVILPVIQRKRERETDGGKARIQRRRAARNLAEPFTVDDLRMDPTTKRQRIGPIFTTSYELKAKRAVKQNAAPSSGSTRRKINWLFPAGLAGRGLHKTLHAWSRGDHLGLFFLRFLHLAVSAPRTFSHGLILRFGVGH